MLGFFYRLTQHQCTEHLGCLRTDFLIAGQQRQVCIQTGSLFIIVARTDLGDVLQAIFCIPDDLAQLGMHFIFAQTINDMAAGILQSAGHFNVIGFIKPRPQLYQNNNFLAVFRGFNQGINNLASFCHTI